MTIDAIDSVRSAMIYPKGRRVSFITGGADKNSVGYSITDSKGWGHSSTLPLEDFMKLVKEVKEGRIKYPIFAMDCDEGLKRMGLSSETLNRIIFGKDKE